MAMMFGEGETRQITDSEWAAMSFAKRVDHLVGTTVDSLLDYNVIWWAVPLCIFLAASHSKAGPQRLLAFYLPVPPTM